MRLSPLILSVVLLAVPCPAAVAAGTTLSEVFTLALRNSEAVAISEQSIAQARALYRRALGSSLPTK